MSDIQARCPHCGAPYYGAYPDRWLATHEQLKDTGGAICNRERRATYCRERIAHYESELGYSRTESWPHSQADNPLLATDGAVLARGDGFDTGNLFVRCHDCLGERSDEDCSCGGTGFDWTDTVDARRTVEAAIGE